MIMPTFILAIAFTGVAVTIPVQCRLSTDVILGGGCSKLLMLPMGSTDRRLNGDFFVSV